MEIRSRAGLRAGATRKLSVESSERVALAEPAAGGTDPVLGPWLLPAAHHGRAGVMYCPRCDRWLTPDHRCVSRRIFLGMLGFGAALGVMTDAEAIAANDAFNMGIYKFRGRSLPIVLPDDVLSVDLAGSADYTESTIAVVSLDPLGGGPRKHFNVTDAMMRSGEKFYVAPVAMQIVGFKMVSADCADGAVSVQVMRTK